MKLCNRICYKCSHGTVAYARKKGYKKIKPLLFDIFPEVTEEELRRTKISELINVMINAAEAAAQSLEVLQKGN